MYNWKQYLQKQLEIGNKLKSAKRPIKYRNARMRLRNISARLTYIVLLYCS